MEGHIAGHFLSCRSRTFGKFCALIVSNFVFFSIINPTCSALAWEKTDYQISIEEKTISTKGEFKYLLVGI